MAKVSRITNVELSFFVEGEEEKLRREYSAIWKIAQEAGIKEGLNKTLTPATITNRNQSELWAFYGDFEKISRFIDKISARLGPNDVLALQLE